jgi:NAD(P)H-dependent flavin oxidoreductase YrpB (nitropropane dioxygenase family)
MILKSLEKKIIQGGMGVAVSNYNLAKEVSIQGGLGVVSGVALETVMIRRLQNGDPTEEIRFALKHFPDQEFSESIINNYFQLEGNKSAKRYKRTPFPLFKLNSDNSLSLKNEELSKLIVAANFVEVFLAKYRHNNPIGINYLYKIRYSTLPAIYGAMLAGVDALLIGAGFAKDIPNALDTLLEHNSTTLPIPVIGETDKILRFKPQKTFQQKELKCPAFFGILSNHMGLKVLSNADAYIFEGPTAGGHNAPARSKSLNNLGEPDYGIKDDMDYSQLKRLLEQNATKTGNVQPYWLAGGYANPKKIKEAQEHGAVGIQTGTPFAFSCESGIENNLKLKILKQIIDGGVVFTSPNASSSGFPFKVFQSKDTISNTELYNSRKRICDLGYLIEIYKMEKEKVFTRCPSEKVSEYIRKGGLEKDTIDKVCLCNALLATVALGSPNEIPIITSGADLSSVKILINKYGFNYSIKNVMDYLLERN